MTYINTNNNKNIRLAAIFRHFYPIMTGAGERFRRYAPGLAKRNVILEVHTSNVAGTHAHSIGTPDIYRYEISQYEHSEMDISLLKALLKKLENADKENLIIQSMSGNRRTHRILAKFRKEYRVPTVFVGTMVEPNINTDGLIIKLKSIIRIFFLRRAYCHFIASSTAMANVFYSLGINHKIISVIPSGVDITRFRASENKPSVREALEIPVESRVTLYVGNLIPRKGIDVLLAAWQQLTANPDHENDLLVIVGSRNRPTFVGEKIQNELREFHHKIEETITKIPKNNIRFIDQSDKIEQWYQIADLFVFPSLKEGMPNAIMEAMACGLPVATTRFIGFPETEFGKEDHEFIIIDHDSEKLALQLSAILVDTGMRTVLGHNARRWTEKHLNLEITLDSYANLYRKLLNQK